jgi:hypothetical protein
VTVEPSSALYGPPAEDDGGSFSSTRTTDGSWSEAWSKNSAFTCTGSNTSDRANSGSLKSTWSSTCPLPSNS